MRSGKLVKLSEEVCLVRELKCDCLGKSIKVPGTGGISPSIQAKWMSTRYENLIRLHLSRNVQITNKYVKVE